jgi:hypothetical protein
MTIPIFNSIYFNTEKKLKSKNIDMEILNNLNLKKIDKIRFPVIKILNNLSKEDSLFETIIVSANDKLVTLFLCGKIKFTDISNILLKICSMAQFAKFKSIKPNNNFQNIVFRNNKKNYSLKIPLIGLFQIKNLFMSILAAKLSGLDSKKTLNIVKDIITNSISAKSIFYKICIIHK